MRKYSLYPLIKLLTVVLVIVFTLEYCADMFKSDRPKQDRASTETASLVVSDGTPKPTVVIAILTHPFNSARREKQRMEWLSELPADFTYRFVVGNLDKIAWDKNRTRNAFKQEMLDNKDIVVFDEYVEKYETIFDKVIHSLKWARQFKNPSNVEYQSQYFVKTDDDIYIDTPKMIDWFRARDRATEKSLYWFLLLIIGGTFL